MRILLAAHHFPPTFRGGAEWRTHRTARSLLDAGHEVRVICVEQIQVGGEDGYQFTDDEYEGVPVRRLYLNLSQDSDLVHYEFQNPLTGRAVQDLVTEFLPDVLHLISGYLISGSVIEKVKELQIPVVLTLTDFWFLCPRVTLTRSDGKLCNTPAHPSACALCLRKEKRRYRLLDNWTGGLVGRILTLAWREGNDRLLSTLEKRNQYLRRMLERSDVVISPSRFLKKLFENQGISLRRFIYMRQGLDLESWIKAKPKPSNDRLRIGYIGQIARHKGVDVLIEAFRQLRPGAQKPWLFLYGDVKQFPNYSNQLRRRTEDLEEIVWAGRFEHAQIAQIHDGLDLLVVPSIWYENSPNVILEAFATGTPVVVSELGGMSELVEEGVNGFRFEAGNASELAERLQQFVDRPDLADRLGKNHPPVKTIQAEIDELAQIYRSLKESKVV